MRKRIHNSKKFPVYKHTTTISGKKVSREIVERPDIAAIVAIEDTKIILVEQNRFPNGIDLEIPSGHLERKEKPIDCAFREFREETPDYFVVGGNTSTPNTLNCNPNIIKAHNFDYDFLSERFLTLSLFSDDGCLGYSVGDRF